jgi:hypothetical protein
MSGFLKFIDWIWSIILSVFMALFAIVLADESYLLLSLFCGMVAIILLPPVIDRITQRPSGIFLRSIFKLGIVIFSFAALAAFNALFKKDPCDEYREVRSSCAASGDYSLCMKVKSPPSCPSEELNDASVGLEKAQNDFVNDILRKY